MRTKYVKIIQTAVFKFAPQLFNHFSYFLRKNGLQSIIRNCVISIIQQAIVFPNLFHRGEMRQLPDDGNLILLLRISK